MTTKFPTLSRPALELANLPVNSGENVSAAAIIHDDRGHILLQLRENLPQVAFGGYWGLFGGRVEAGETPLSGLVRELQEELSAEPPTTPDLYSTVAWNGGGIGDSVRTRHYFLVPISSLVLSDFKLGEGADMAVVAREKVPQEFHVMPHDHLALSMFWGAAYSDARG